MKKPKMKKPKLFATISALLAIFLILTTTEYFRRNVDAANLTAAYLYLSRMEANVSSGVQIELAIDPSQSFATGGTLTITFPDADDGNWCRTAGTMTVTGITSSVADQASSNWDIDAALPGTLSGSCTQGSGASSFDTITVTGLTGLTGGTTYGVRIVANSGALGTDDTAGSHITTITVNQGATTDSSTFDVELVADDTVTITATVAAAPTVTCSLSSTSINLGTLYTGGAYSTGTHTITASTSANASGYYWTVYGTGDGSTDAGLYKSTATTYLIASTGSTTVNLSSTEGFGLVASAPAGATVASDFSDGTPGTFGAIDRAFSGAQMLLYQGSAETGGDTSTITYGAKAGNSAEAGSYTENVTFVCGGYY